MAEMIRGQLKDFFNESLEGQKQWMNERFEQFEEKTSKQLNDIENVINSKAMDTGHFNQGLKAEMEMLENKHKKANIENLHILKTLSQNVRTLKDHNRNL